MSPMDSLLTRVGEAMGLLLGKMHIFILVAWPGFRFILDLFRVTRGRPSQPLCPVSEDGVNECPSGAMLLCCCDRNLHVDANQHLRTGGTCPLRAPEVGVVGAGSGRTG